MRGHYPDLAQRSLSAARCLHRAAIQPDPLVNWAKILTDHLESAASLTLLGPAGGMIDIGTTEPYEPEHLDYVARYQFINPLTRFWEVAPVGEIIHFDQRLITDECRRSEFYSRYSHYLVDHDGVCMLLAAGRFKILVHLRLPRHEGAAAKAKALLAGLRDDLNLSLEIAAAFLDANSVVRSVIDSLDREGVGLAVLSPDGRVKNANSRMTAFLQREGAGSDLARTKSASFVVGAPRGWDPDQQADRARVAVYSAAPAFDKDARGKGKVVLLMSDDAAKRADLKKNLRTRYGLTPAETRVAERLREGRTSRQIATEFGIQTNCVRSHLKAIYAKTATHSQVELLNFLERDS